MKRGDIIIVATSGDYGKPRPAVVVQTDAVNDVLGSVIICQFTTDLFDAPRTRITTDSTPENGLRERSQIMVDKPTTVPRKRVGAVIGRLTDEQMTHLNKSLGFMIGLSD